jgi:pyruvate dehydrogenase E2 component (dihydrolipoamide acetyltransferase)
LALDIDVEPALAWLASENERRSVTERLLPAALLLKAAALAAAEVPAVNGHWVDGGFVPGEGVHLGVAVSLRTGGLIAPPSRRRQAHAHRGDGQLARPRQPGPHRPPEGSELTGATITVTNLGDNASTSCTV